LRSFFNTIKIWDRLDHGKIAVESHNCTYCSSLHDKFSRNKCIEKSSDNCLVPHTTQSKH
jgi:hypothetical protein